MDLNSVSHRSRMELYVSLKQGFRHQAGPTTTQLTTASPRKEQKHLPLSPVSAVALSVEASQQQPVRYFRRNTGIARCSRERGTASLRPMSLKRSPGPKTRRALKTAGPTPGPSPQSTIASRLIQ